MKRSTLILYLFILLSSCQTSHSQDHDMDKKKNALRDETSPYLLQHVYNPVNWHPWNEETLEKAKKENKMLIISVGYSACHWCHVMEHESFEDDSVAAIMNKYFLPIKVDREERPDVDDVYMTACQLASQRGCGWPLNAFALPDGRPFWAGTYFPREQWINVLEHFVDMYHDEKETLENAAEKLMEGIAASESLVSVTEPEIMPIEVLSEITEGYLTRADQIWGGRRGAPKFPMPSNYNYLLQKIAQDQDSPYKEYVELALMRMSHGGIYDHVVGGWARYSVDERWHVPHFEKMLYDNGQLLTLYANAYALFKTPYLKEKVLQTFSWLEHEMKDPSGGYYSAIDADSEGEEGKFYVWTENELQSILDETSYVHFKKYFTIQKKGNWEHNLNVLHQTERHEDIAESLGISSTDLTESINASLQKVQQERDKRIRPGTDDKILTSWNALTLIGLCKAARSHQNQDIALRAISLGDFLISQIKSDGSIYRNYKNGKRSIAGFLDDYAITALSLIELHQLTHDDKYLESADRLVRYANDHFYDPATQLYFYVSDKDNQLITRKKEINDNVIPSSNSYMGHVLYALGRLLSKEEYLTRSKQMAETISPSIADNQNPHFWSHWLQLIDLHNSAELDIAVVGPDAISVAEQLMTHYSSGLYHVSTVPSDKQLLQNKCVDDQTLIYVCRNKSCKLPTSNVDKARELIAQDSY